MYVCAYMLQNGADECINSRTVILARTVYHDHVIVFGHLVTTHWNKRCTFCQPCFISLMLFIAMLWSFTFSDSVTQPFRNTERMDMLQLLNLFSHIGLLNVAMCLHLYSRATHFDFVPYLPSYRIFHVIPGVF